MNDVATIDQHDTVTLVRDLPGPIDRVWAYLTQIEHLSEWLSGGEFSTRVGGNVRLDMGAQGTITIFEPPHLLEYTWNEPNKSRGPVLDTLVRFELAEQGDRVRLTLTHMRLSPPEAIAHAAGWHAFMDRFSATMNGTPPPDVMERIAELRPHYDNTSCSP